MYKLIKNKKILSIIPLVIIVTIYLLYYIYKIRTGIEFTYIDEETNTRMVNFGLQGLAYIILVILSVLSIVIYKFLEESCNKKRLKAEQIFLIIAIIFSTLMMIAMPMTNGHDESIHAMRIYEYVEGNFISNGKNAYLEKGITNSLEPKHYYIDIFNNKETYSTDTEKTEWGYRVAPYSPVNYLPQIIGIYTAKIFTSNSMIQLYVARLFNLAACITILYFAIKIIPYGKNLLFLLSCIPIAVEGFATLSADGLLIAASFFWISYILHLIQEKDKKISKKDIIILAVTAATIALSKTIYIVLLLLLLLIPKEKWKNRRQAIITILSIFVVCTILDIGWYFIGIQRENSISNKDAINYIVHSPIQYIAKIIYTIVNNFEKYIREVFGGALEWNEQTLVPIFPYIILIASILMGVKTKEKEEWTTWQKIIIITTIISCVFLVFTSMFLTWSRIDIQKIDGIQGRYFIPILPLVFLLFGRKFKDELKQTYNIANLVLTMQFFVIMQLIIHHI